MKKIFWKFKGGKKQQPDSIYKGLRIKTVSNSSACVKKWYIPWKIKGQSYFQPKIVKLEQDCFRHKHSQDFHVLHLFSEAGSVCFSAPLITQIHSQGGWWNPFCNQWNSNQREHLREHLLGGRLWCHQLEQKKSGVKKKEKKNWISY